MTAAWLATALHGICRPGTGRVQFESRKQPSVSRVRIEIAAILLSTLHLSLAVVSAGHALMYKRDPRASIGWFVVCVAVPFAGPIAYFMLGINRVRTAARAYRRGLMLGFERPVRAVPADHCPLPARGLAAVGAAVTGNPLVSGNKVLPLLDGEQAFSSMLAVIREAREYIHLATYIFETGPVGREFVEALRAAADRGVDIRVLVDGVGQHYAFPSVKRLLRRAGIENAVFLPPRLIPPSLHVNLRNHRKILVADGAVAFTGGMNIGERHVRRADGTRACTDVHFRVEGPIVVHLDEAFCHDWYFASRRHAPVFAGRALACGDAVCRLIVDGPDENLDRLAMVIQGVVGAASQRIDIVTPYFLPSLELIAALRAARNRGVRVRVILPAKSNLPFVHWATRNLLWQLLLWDIEVCYQQPPFAHTKLLLIDDGYALIGTANIDPRSLRLNFELGVEIFDRSVVAELDEHVTGICATAHYVTLEELDRRPVWQRARDSFFWLFSPYL